MKKEKKYVYVVWGAMLHDKNIGIPISERELVIVNTYRNSFAEHCKVVDNLFA